MLSRIYSGTTWTLKSNVRVWIITKIRTESDDQYKFLKAKYIASRALSKSLVNSATIQGSNLTAKN